MRDLHHIPDLPKWVVYLEESIHDGLLSCSSLQPCQRTPLFPLTARPASAVPARRLVAYELQHILQVEVLPQQSMIMSVPKVMLPGVVSLQAFAHLYTH